MSRSDALKKTAIFCVLAILALLFQNCSEQGLNLAADVSQVAADQKKSCIGPTGETISHGANSQLYFKSSSAGCGGVCEQDTLFCDNGELIGEAQETACEPQACDIRNIAGGTAENLKPGASYLVNVYGFTTNRDGNQTLAGVRVENCQAVSLAQTQSQVINWHAGSAPQSASLAITAPVDGCIKALTDLGEANTIALSEISSQKDNISIVGNQVTGLKAGRPYLINVYGITTNRGTGITNLGAVRVEDCNGGVLQATVDPIQINWHDGSAPHNAALAIQAPADGCIRGFTDGGAALNMTATEFSESAATSVNQITGLIQGKRYLVSVYGITANREGNGNDTVRRVRVEDCNGTVVAESGEMVVNWPNGHVPHAFTLALEAPASGCVAGFTDEGDSRHISTFLID